MLLRNAVWLFTVAGFLYTDTALARATAYTDEQIKQQIIDESIASYPGSCACPFNSAKNGSRCGRRSAWNKAGGSAPVCFKDEVTKKRVDKWRQAHQA